MAFANLLTVQLSLPTTKKRQQSRSTQSGQGNTGRFGNGGDVNRSERGNIGNPNIDSDGFEAVLNVAGRIVKSQKVDAEHTVHQWGSDCVEGRVVRSKILDECHRSMGTRQGVGQNLTGEGKGLPRECSISRLHIHVRIHDFVAGIAWSPTTDVPEGSRITYDIGGQGQNSARKSGAKIGCSPATPENRCSPVRREFRNVHKALPRCSRIYCDGGCFCADGCANHGAESEVSNN